MSRRQLTELPVFACPLGVALDVGDGVVKERQLRIAWALWQNDESRVQLGVCIVP